MKDTLAKNKNKKYITRFTVNGDVIDEFDAVEKARLAIQQYEDQDKKEGNYEENYYEIVDEEGTLYLT